MKKILLSITFAFCFLLVAAQPKAFLGQLDKGEIDSEQYAQSTTEHYSKVVSLNAEQQTKIQAIYAKEAQKLQTISSLKPENPIQHAEKENAVFINTRQAVKLVLDRKQWRKYVLHERMNKLKE